MGGPSDPRNPSHHHPGIFKRPGAWMEHEMKKGIPPARTKNRGEVKQKSDIDISIKCPDLQIDDPVIVWDYEGATLRRHFAGWTESGKIKAWERGKTSKEEPSALVWNHWELPEADDDRGDE